MPFRVALAASNPLHLLTPLVSLYCPVCVVESQTKCFENMLDMINLTYFGNSQTSGMVQQQQQPQHQQIGGALGATMSTAAWAGTAAGGQNSSSNPTSGTRQQ